MVEKVYIVYAFEEDTYRCYEYLLAVCSSEEKAKRHILNLIKQDMATPTDDETWVYSLSNPPTENDFDMSDNSIVASKGEVDEDGFCARCGYFYSEWEVM